MTTAHLSARRDAHDARRVDERLCPTVTYMDGEKRYDGGWTMCTQCKRCMACAPPR